MNRSGTLSYGVYYDILSNGIFIILDIENNYRYNNLSCDPSLDFLSNDFFNTSYKYIGSRKLYKYIY